MRIDGTEGSAQDPEQLAATREIRRATRTNHLTTGTLACPSCDAPVAPGPVPLRPTSPLFCPLCDHAGPLREFLSLEAPARPARVIVRVVAPAALRITRGD